MGTGEAGHGQAVMEEILKGTDLVSIDVHTSMWLWSRGKFSIEI